MKLYYREEPILDKHQSKHSDFKGSKEEVRIYDEGYESACRNYNILTGKDADDFIKKAEANSTETLSEQEVKDIHKSYDILKEIK